MWAIPDPIRDEAVTAFIVPAPGPPPSRRAARAFCAQLLARFKVPTVLDFATSCRKRRSARCEDVLRAARDVHGRLLDPVGTSRTSTSSAGPSGGTTRASPSRGDATRGMSRRRCPQIAGRDAVRAVRLTMAWSGAAHDDFRLLAGYATATARRSLREDLVHRDGVHGAAEARGGELREGRSGPLLLIHVRTSSVPPRSACCSPAARPSWPGGRVTREEHGPPSCGCGGTGSAFAFMPSASATSSIHTPRVAALAELSRVARRDDVTRAFVMRALRDAVVARGRALSIRFAMAESPPRRRRRHATCDGPMVEPGADW